MGLLTKNKAPEPVQQREDAVRRRQELADSLPVLREQAAAATERREAADAALERVEGDALSGAVTDAALTAHRAQHEAAVTEERRAAAAVQQAQQDLVRLDATIARITAAAHAVRIAELRGQYEPLVQELRDKVQALVSLNDTIHALYAQAEAEFPHRVQRDGVTSHVDIPWRRV